MTPPATEPPAPSLLSVNVGMPQDVPWEGRTVRTGVWKYAVDGPRRARRGNLDGDGQGDTAGHGGEQRAVMVYQIASYRYWQQHLGRDDFEYGQFGENLTVDGLPDEEVSIRAAGVPPPARVLPADGLPGLTRCLRRCRSPAPAHSPAAWR